MINPAAGNRIQKKFMALRRQKKKALIIFMTAGDPSLAANEKLIQAFEKDGVDLIELGVPFSDPLADGPVIQASSQRSLKRGTNLGAILKLVRRVRKKSQTPIVLMSYLNPILSFGIGRFAKEAREAGVDGLIIPDLPPEEGKEISSVLRRARVDLIYLLAPTSTPSRRLKISKASRGFIYYVSLTGVTGVRSKLSGEISKNIRAVKKMAYLPVCVGFGVSTPGQAAAVARAADGVIIGSAIVRALAANPHAGAGAFSKKFIRPFARALGRKVQ